MDLKSGYPYFLLRTGLNRNYQSLQTDYVTDVAIIGGGVSGALIAYYLSKQGVSCCVADGRSIGLGSTCASTSLIQYELDVPLFKLKQLIGWRNAEKAYKLCYGVFDKLEDIAGKIGYNEYTNCGSIYFAHHARALSQLKHEYAVRKKAGFEVEIITGGDPLLPSGSIAAIVSSKAAKIDSYLFTHCLHKHNSQHGVEVFEDTNVKGYKKKGSSWLLNTNKGHTITSKKIVFATGYTAATQLPSRLVKLMSTYALVGKKNRALPPWFKDHLFWNTANPYLYLREADDRIIIGGRDEMYYNPSKRDKLLGAKAKQLVADFKKLFPEIGIEPEFNWTGTFATTKDGLPFIGNADDPDLYYALGYGGNGITFSVLAAEYIAREIAGDRRVIPPFFKFNR